MMSSKDREQLQVLNVIAAPHSRDSYKTSSMPWKNEPTPINSPANPPVVPRTVHQSGTNPYGNNPNRQRRVGNTTSTRVLSKPFGDPPPRKKVKTEHTPHAASGGPYAGQGDGSNIHSKYRDDVPLAPETIDIDDNSLWDGDNSYTNIISSPDELNICSPSTEEAYPSKYKFNTTRHGSTIQHNNSPIVPDGQHTEWAKDMFSQGSGGHKASPFWGVREKVAKIEAKTRTGDPPRVDLTEKVKAKHRMKNKDHIFFPREHPFREQQPQVPTSKNVLPLKELYLDGRHYNGGGLEIFWLRDDKLCIKSDKRHIFGPIDIRTHCRSLTYHSKSKDSPDIRDPIFQLTMIPDAGKRGSDVRCLTIKVDGSSPGPQETYIELLEWLKVRVDKKEFIRAFAREQLWERAQIGAGVMEVQPSTKRGDLGKSRRLDEFLEDGMRRTRRNLIDDQSKPPVLPKRSASRSSMRITPPTMVSESGKQKLEQRPRQDSSELPESVIPRRSTRSTSGATRSPALDSDEVILVYPPGVPGAVNITNGDFRRLQPGEFLNDTLIEFGLKLWLKELEQINPILASQIHVFNSFFYKKLNHQKKGINLSYESVRKWTSKFDIFQKKYIIVPINEHLHWYFAIICEPEHVLIPTASNVPSTRQQTRQSISEAMITEEPTETSTASKPVSTSVSENDRDGDKLGTPSEAEVEHTLHDFKGSCSISNIEPGENVAGSDGGRSPSALSYVSDNISTHMPRSLSPTASDHGRALLRHSPPDDKMAMDLADDLPAISRDANHDDDQMRSVDAVSFYQRVPPRKDKGKGKAGPHPESSVMEIDDDDDDNGGSVLSDTPKTYIFIFDSLGGRHPQAIKKLSSYLKMEAQDKKKVSNAGNAEGKSAMVPVQPNFCDCGIYLLHLAQTFMSDPAHYRRVILAQKPKSVPNLERQVVWNDHQVMDKRDDLAARITELSEEWKKERAAKEAAKQKEVLNSRTFEVVESSDNEIDILESTPSTSKAKAGGRKKTGHAVTRLRG